MMKTPAWLPLGSDGPTSTIADPATGLHLSISGIDMGEAICPSCSARTLDAAFVAVVEDLRLLFACPSCLQITWLSGA